MLIPNSLEARDVAFHLHGYTDALKHLAVGPLVIESGDGVYVTDSAGKRYIEAMAGLWSVAVGFSETRLVDAAAHQMARLPFYHTFSHKSHGPLIMLAEKLVELVPGKMSKVFFTNSGSEANDTALKLIWYRANALGQPQRKKVIVRDRAYHGVTIASASMTGLVNNHRSFDLPLTGIGTLRARCPHLWREGAPGETEDEFSTRLAAELEDLILNEGPETIAAFFGEPVQGAGGVIVPPEGYWRKVQAVLNKYDILLVADEVITGFGRTGALFGCETYDIRPDIVVVSKALSSSYLPISAMLLNEKVFAPIAEESGRIGVLGHGFTAGGHPVAAAVALENIRIIEERNLVDNAAKMGERLRSGLYRLAEHPLVGEVRGVGLIAAVELVTDKDTKSNWGASGRLGGAVNALLQEEGIIARNMGDAIAFCPPLIINEDEVDLVLQAFETALHRALELTQKP